MTNLNQTNQQLAERIARALAEPRADLIEAAINELGQDRAVLIFHRTAEVQAKGGMLTCDRSRKRTPGGVFFQIAKRTMSAAQRGRAGLRWQRELTEAPAPAIVRELEPA